jgi:hypothetical protein
MPEMKSVRMGSLAKAILIANACFWLYFWVAFAHSSQPYDPRPWGHGPVDLYSFWGYAIGLTRSSFLYPFMQIAYWVQFPSFLVATLIQNTVFARVSADQFLAGISVGGYKLLAIMVLSFFQWYLVACVVQNLWRRWFRDPTAVSGRSPSPPVAG